MNNATQMVSRFAQISVTMPRNWEANTFVMRQTDPAFAGTVVTEADIEVICDYINLREDKGREGYAPFVTKWDIPVNLLTGTYCGEAEITPENSHLLKSGYKTRREGELPYLTRWFEGMEKPEATRVVAICYSREQLSSEKESVNGLKGDLILVLAGPSREVDPSDTMDPATMLRNALGKEFGGSGHPLDREMYVRMCEYYDSHALIG